VAPKINANKLPFNSWMAFQTKTIVRAPNNAGKNLIQNSELPKSWIIYEIHEVTGGTDKYPQAK
jgi:hypothetical protein